MEDTLVRDVEITPSDLDINIDGLDDAVSEAISDITGYCHVGFTYKIVATVTLDVSD